MFSNGCVKCIFSSEFPGIWEQLSNPDFKPIEFDGFKKSAGLNCFTITPTVDRGKTARFNTPVEYMKKQMTDYICAII